ncbi:fluoride efflux transporter FluC [Rufibacter soli]
MPPPSLIIGVLEQGLQANKNLNLLFITGFCGDFTTFSTFSSENLALLQSNNHLTALL